MQRHLKIIEATYVISHSDPLPYLFAITCYALRMASLNSVSLSGFNGPNIQDTNWPGWWAAISLLLADDYISHPQMSLLYLLYTFWSSLQIKVFKYFWMSQMGVGEFLQMYFQLYTLSPVHCLTRKLLLCAVKSELNNSDPNSIFEVNGDI